MLLYQIIRNNDAAKFSILTEILFQYKKSLYTYYKDMFNCEPVLMVTTVYNAAQYALIVPSNELGEAIDNWVNLQEDSTEEEKEEERELIGFQSIMLKDF